MRLPQIRIQSQPALISLQPKNAIIEQQQPRADLDLQQPPAELKMETTPSKLTIDQTAARESIDLKSIKKRIEEFADEGHKEWLEGIARRAKEGEELMRIEDGGNPIAAHAKQNSERPEKQFNIGFVPPLFSVKLHYEPSKVDIQVQVNKVINNTKTNKPTLDYTPGKVEVGLRQRESLNIDYVNVNFQA
ncbi:DUF6470 family protein [Bacillus sp. JJ722]|uniref:DUF6470 family protein n=1 Tax=Bacillus sp. JJ722 TaxID=3122973 RepID=UPI002FFF2C43